jgi:tetratricopeptide (TPR) repeat protein
LNNFNRLQIFCNIFSFSDLIFETSLRSYLVLNLKVLYILTTTKIKMKKLFSAIIAVIFCLIVQFSIIIAQSPTPTPTKSMTDDEASKILDDLQSGKMKIDPCLGASIGGFVTFTKTATGMKTNLRDTATLREIVSDCDISLKSKDSYERMQQKTYLRGMARYYLIRGLNSPLNAAFNDLSKLSETEIQQASIDLKTASDGAIESAENNLAYLYSGEMLALLAVKRKDKSLYDSALAQWRSAEDQSMILKPEQAASAKKTVAENRLALEAAWKNPVSNSLTLRNNAPLSASTAQTTAPAKTNPTAKTTSITQANSSVKAPAVISKVKAIPANMRLADEAAQRASDFFENGDLKAAAAEAEKALKLDPQNSSALKVKENIQLTNDRVASSIAFDSASEFFDKGDLKSALIETEKALRFYPKNHLALTLRGNIHLKNNEKPQAMAKFGEAIAADPNSYLPYYMRARAYALDRNFKAAIADSNKAIENSPKCARCYFYRGVYYSELINWDQARDDAKKALELKPDWAEAKKNYEYFAEQAVGIDATTIPDPKEVEEKRNSNAAGNSSSNNGALSAMYSIEMTYDQQADELKEAVRKYENGRRCDPLQEVKSIAWDIKTFLEKQIRSYEYGNIKLTRNEYNRLQTMLGKAEENVGIFARLGCR